MERDVSKEGVASPGEIHHNVKEGTDVGVRVSSRVGKSTGSHGEIKRSGEWAETRW